MKGYTIQHSIDLLEDQVEDLQNIPTGGSTAADITYDNTTSHLTADDVQEAIDELTTSVNTNTGDIATLKNGKVYSTTEHVVGKWVDGRDIYEKTYTDVNLGNNTTVNVDTISDMDLMIYAYGAAYNKTTSGSFRPLAFADTGGNAIRVSTTNNQIQIQTYVDWSGYAANLTLQYVKAAPETNTRKRSKKTEEE